MGHLTAALTEYRIALADDPANVSLWLELGRTAQNGGRSPIAREAFHQAWRLSPQNPEIAKLLHDSEQNDAQLRKALLGSAQDPELAK